MLTESRLYKGKVNDVSSEAGQWPLFPAIL